MSARPKLPWQARFMELQYWFAKRIRPRQAFTIGHEAGTEEDFRSLRKAHQCLVVSFKRSGDPVPTPVIFGLAHHQALYFRTLGHVAKTKRIERDPHIRICATNMWGKPTGPVVEATARILPASEDPRAHAIIAANWAPLTRPLERFYDLIRIPVVYVEVRPTASDMGHSGCADTRRFLNETLRDQRRTSDDI